VTNPLKAGAGRTIINPPLGIKTVGFTAREGVVEGIESDLSATTLVLADDNTRVAIVALDVCIAPLNMVRDWRRQVADAIGTLEDNVLINLSHSHSAAALPGCPPEFAFQSDLIERYYDELVPRIVESAARANAALTPARIAAGQGESHIGINRREMGPDGLIFLGEAPDKAIDSAVGVVRVDNLDGAPIAILCSYGCHTVVVGPNSRVASPDFPGATRAAVERAMGGLTLFLQGGGGDIMPVGGMGFETDCSDAKNRLGTMLAGEVLKIAAGLRTHVQRGERTALRSLLGSGMTLTPWVPVDGHECSYLGAISESVVLDLLPFPSLAEAEAIRVERARELEEAKASGQERNVTVTGRFIAWADGLVEAVRSGRPNTAECEIQAIRVNDIVFIGISAEVFSATTVAIRDRSPFPRTIVLGYSNGTLCYLPRAQDYPPRGWDLRTRYRIPDMVFQAYGLPTGLAPTSEGRVVAAVLGLLERIKQPVVERAPSGSFA
jgi:Neutral/alkaline non-lysosomal ceramidase, N-terminal